MLLFLARLELKHQMLAQTPPGMFCKVSSLQVSASHIS